MVNLADIINQLNLDELELAIAATENGSGKKEIAGILHNFEANCLAATEEEVLYLNPETQQKLVLLLNFYHASPTKEEIYGKLINLSNKFQVLQLQKDKEMADALSRIDAIRYDEDDEQSLSEPSILVPDIDMQSESTLSQVASQQEKLDNLKNFAFEKLSRMQRKYNKVSLCGELSRIFTPNQVEEPKDRGAAVQALDEQYQPGIPDNIQVVLAELHAEILKVVGSEISLAEKLQLIILNYEKCISTLDHQSRAFLFPLLDQFLDEFNGRLESGENKFTRIEIFNELIDAYLNMCLQYANPKIGYSLSGSKEDKIFKLALNSILQVRRAIAPNVSLSKMVIEKTKSFLELQRDERRLALKQIVHEIDNIRKVVKNDKKKKYMELLEVLNKYDLKEIDAMQAIAEMHEVLEKDPVIRAIKRANNTAIEIEQMMQGDQQSDKKLSLEIEVEEFSNLYGLLSQPNDKTERSITSSSWSGPAARSAPTATERRQSPYLSYYRSDTTSEQSQSASSQGSASSHSAPVTSIEERTSDDRIIGTRRPITNANSSRLGLFGSRQHCSPTSSASNSLPKATTSDDDNDDRHSNAEEKGSDKEDMSP